METPAYVIRVNAPRLRGSPVFAVTVIDDTVVEAAPIAKWTIGKRWSTVRTWFVKNGNATFDVLTDDTE